MLIQAGTLSTKIQIYKRAVNTVKGISSVSYSYYKDKWCDWRQLTSKELMRNGMEYTIDVYTVRIRYDSTVTTADQVKLKGRTYNIKSVVHDIYNQSTILTLEAGVTK
ncbi:MAG: phage head closure protein [Succinivibrio sp.]|jgi:SPP1 family predicted phage head-tail adaptor|uniref:phage head closure protein n=1 Tax=Succinivibrio sp. TaxID=2053619 RepID=UPI002F92C74B